VIKKLTAFHKAIFALAAGIAFFFSGCQPKPPPPVMEPFPEEKVEEVVEVEEVEDIEKVIELIYDLAEKDYQAGDYEFAKNRFKFYLEKLPDGERARDALYRIAKISYSENLFQDALEYLKRVVEEHPDHPETAQVKYEIIITYIALEDYQGAKIAAFEWLEGFHDNPLEGEVLFLLGTILDQLGDNLMAFACWLNASDRFPRLSVTRDDIESGIISLINKGSLDELKEMVRYGAGSVFIPNIYYRIAYLSLKEYKLYDSEKAAMALIRSTPEQFWVNIGRTLLDRISNEFLIKREAIGCLLPLSGPYAIFGQEALNGIQLGMGLFEESGEGKDLELIIKDTGGDPEKAVSGVEDLVIREKVIAIIGPLASKTATAASKRAQEMGIPIITLTQKDGITDEGDMVFRNFLTPEKEIESLLDQAVNQMELQRFAIFYPNNPYGRFFMNRFWDGVDERGGEITAVESYEPDATDFADQIKKMVGLYYPRPESVIKMLEEMKMLEAEKEGVELSEIDETLEEGLDEEVDEEDEEEPEPIIDFDAIFIPDNYQQVALIAPQFPYYSIFNIPLLGTSLWQSMNLIDTAGDYVQGAVFTSGFFPGSNAGQQKDFIRLYRETFDSDPGILAANGFDTMRFVKSFINDIPIKTRKDFKDGISQYIIYGVTGEISFDYRGEVEKTPVLLTVAGKRIKILPKPKSVSLITN
jgi:ABC-type branched-subunit amino acid transport system substrate-binding protein